MRTIDSLREGYPPKKIMRWPRVNVSPRINVLQLLAALACCSTRGAFVADAFTFLSTGNAVLGTRQLLSARVCHRCQTVASDDTDFVPQNSIQQIDMCGQELRLCQHFFDTPVPQPRGLYNRHADLSGLRLWPTSHPFLQRIQTNILPAMRQELRGRSSRPLRILELGSGCGLLGLGVGHTGEVVVVTDPAIDVNLSEHYKSNTLEHLRENIALNPACADCVTAEKLVWGDTGDMRALSAKYDSNFDLIIGCDLLYNPDSYAALLATMQWFSQGAPVMLGYPPRLPGEVHFFEAVREHFDVSTGPLDDQLFHPGVLAQCRRLPQ